MLLLVMYIVAITAEAMTGALPVGAVWIGLASF